MHSFTLQYLASMLVLSRARIWAPLSFVFNASELHPLNSAKSEKNCKYANDFYLIVPSPTLKPYVTAELENIANWVRNNNLKLSRSESREMIVRKPRAGSSTNPLCPHTLDRAGSWDGSAWCNAHGYPLIPPARRSYCCPYCSNVICSAPSPIPYPIGAPQLFDVARATFVAHPTYASPAWQALSFAKIKHVCKPC